MRKQIVVTDDTQEILSEILGEDVPTGTQLTVTAPKNQIGRSCECGCGGKTSGGFWVPGHDAKHKSRLFSLARGAAGDEQAEIAKAELLRRQWGLPTTTRSQQVAPLPVPEA